MNKENVKNEVVEYLKSVWHKPTEEPKLSDGDSVYLMVRDKWDNFSSYKLCVDDDWDAEVEDKDIISWAYLPSLILVDEQPNLKDYKSIKTYEDACTALGESVDEEKLSNAGVPKHIIALMKLELVCKALWGGEVKVYPDAEGSRIYYYPWFWLYTKNEIDSMSDKERGLLLSAAATSGALAGWGSAHTHYRSSYSSAHCGFRLCLDTSEKALYFGQQFVELWAEYLAYNFTVGERLK